MPHLIRMGEALLKRMAVPQDGRASSGRMGVALWEGMNESLLKDGRGSSRCHVDAIELRLHVGRALVLFVDPPPLPLDLDASLLDDASMMFLKLFCAARGRTGHLAS